MTKKDIKELRERSQDFISEQWVRYQQAGAKPNTSQAVEFINEVARPIQAFVEYVEVNM